jgi:hypothetical protein
VAPTAPASGTEPTRNREWWRREAARVGSDWSSIIALHTAAVMSSRIHHDPDCADMPMTACPICGAWPCINPSFCDRCRKADAKLRAEKRNRPELIPQDWDHMSLDALWHAVNYERHRPTPQTTIEAIMYCVRERGLTVLKEPANIERLIRCNQAAKEQIDRRIAKLVAEGRLS